MQQRQHIFFIFKEAINNIVKYASAKKTTVQLQKKEGNIVLLIRDDGVGFDMNEIHSGNGLINMQQRAELVKGRLVISAKKNEGTSIQLQLPIA